MGNGSRISIFILLSLTLLTFCVSCKQEAAEAPQNIVFILVDDLGWNDLGYSGSSFYESPNLDKLSRESFQFTQAYASGSVCSPTRAAILTGQHPARLNITDWIPGRNDDGRELVGPTDLDALPLQQRTLPEVLQTNGYQTFFAGKWHLGGEGYYPEDQGFDENHGGHDKGSPPGGYYSPYKNPRLTDGPENEYLPDRLTDESIDFLNRAGETPFLLYLSYYTVHTPIQASKKHIEYFEEKLSTIDEPFIEAREEKLGMTTMHQYNPAYASMVYAMDENVGRLITSLKELGLYENTTIVFTSDNGGLSTLDKTWNRAGPTSVAPLRGGKGWLYEGGIRIPLLIKPAYQKTTGRLIDIPVVSHDLFPTLCDLTNTDTKDIPTDGISLAPLFESPSDLDRDELFWHYPHYHGSGWTPGAALREGDWKLITFYESNENELYNLTVDISESNDLASQYPDRVELMSKRLIELQKSVGAQLPRSSSMLIEE